jgi:hypothetical protein
MRSALWSWVPFFGPKNLLYGVRLPKKIKRRSVNQKKSQSMVEGLLVIQRRKKNKENNPKKIVLLSTQN